MNPFEHALDLTSWLVGGLTPVLFGGQLGEPEPSWTRRQAALRRYQILHESFADLVRCRVRSVYKDAEVTEGLERWADTSTLVNPALDITRALACVYKRPAIRQFSDGNNELETAWTKIHHLLRSNLKLKQVNRYAYGMGPVCVLPSLSPTGKPRLQYFAPHRFEPFWGDDPEAPPDAVALDLRPMPSLHAPALVVPKGQPAIVIVDRETWRYLDTSGEPVRGPAGLEVMPHGIVDADGEPVCPAVFFRVDEPIEEDWWNRTRGRRLFDATIVAGVHWCRWHYVRQYQDSKQLISQVSDDTDVANGGVIGHPAKPVELRGETAVNAKIHAVDHSIDIDGFLRTINAVISAAALGEGLPAESVTLSAPLDAGRMQGTRLVRTGVTDDLRAQHRHDQIPYATAFEAQLAERIVAMLRADGSELARALPPVDEVAERHYVEFAELTVIDDPAAQRDQDLFDLQHGLISRVDLVRRRWPNLSREQCLDLLKRNANEQAEVWAIQAARNQPRDPDALAATPIEQALSPAQANGRMGPAARDGDDDNGQPNDSDADADADPNAD